MNPREIADRWYNSNIFAFNQNAPEGQETFSVDTPPPTVSGTLHMGHVFSYCHCDFIARFKRLYGANVFYPIGFDDNGLPTERLVEKRNNVRAVVMSKNGQKEEFLKMCEQVVREDEAKFEDLFKSTGLSFDWSRKYQTISPSSSKIAQMSFADLFLKGLAYISNAPVYWDTTDQTALAQAEIEEKEMPSHATNLIFTTKEDSQEAQAEALKIMTTRPEMLPACLCLLYHPQDDRYNGKAMGKTAKIQLVDGTEEEIACTNLAAKTAKTPFGLSVPILQSSSVAMEKGTGLVMCCSFGDWQDVLWCKELGLTPKTIITDHGRIANAHYQQISQPSQGAEGNQSATQQQEQIPEILNAENSKTVIDARAWSIAHLQSLTFQHNGKQTPYITNCTKISHPVKCGERSGKPLEILNKPQWYISLGFQKQGEGSSHCYFINNISPKETPAAAPNHKNQGQHQTSGLFNPYKTPAFGASQTGITNTATLKQQPQKEVESNPSNTLHAQKPAEELPSQEPAEAKTINSFQANLLQMANEIQIFPNNMKIKLTQWIENLAHDWCISRNRFAGIDIPKIAILCLKNNPSQFAILPISANHAQTAYQAIIEQITQGQPTINVWEEITKEAAAQNVSPQEYIKQQTSQTSQTKQTTQTKATWLAQLAQSIQQQTNTSLTSLLGLINGSNNAQLVFDTWFTSSVSPQINTGKITCSPQINNAFQTTQQQSQLNQSIYPFTIRPQAHEIIRTWTFYTMAKAYLHAIEFQPQTNGWAITHATQAIENNGIKQIMPWKQLVLSGWCLASDKTKMSKSKGNIVDPVNLINQYGADAVRYWASTAHLGVDTPYSENNIKEGIRLVKKLQNIVKFIDPYTSSGQAPLGNNYSQPKASQLQVIDQWIISKLALTLQNYIKHFSCNDYCRAREEIESFFWNDLCDNYIEIIKGRIYGSTSFVYQTQPATEEEIKANQTSAASAANLVIEASMVMLAPFIPFATDQIYLTRHNINLSSSLSIHSIGTLKKIHEIITEISATIPAESAQAGEDAVQILTEVRKYKAQHGLSVKAPIKSLTVPKIPNGCLFDIISVCNALTAEIIENSGQPITMEH